MNQGKVPFSWEDLPGVSKTGTDQKPPYFAANKLQPPPYKQGPSTRKVSSTQMQRIPLPPCPFQPRPPTPAPSRRNSGKKEDDDPFLLAYRECTKDACAAEKTQSKHGGGSGTIRKRLSALSCKQSSCSVRDGNLVRLSNSEL
ncbi:hypothetical protein SAY87_003103 [Trapa incisa]|uniref:Uncharacterized protein n=1 Tax=Trapa incisa TaxID=236973 RepID=A0AAN7KRY6_9MYRT|nr:hypothetical protein SAY87_003103 [Trapa incisa]